MKHDDYVQLLRFLLPRGLAFAGSVYQRFIDGLSVEFARVDQRAGELSHELLPDTTTELLGDWEQIFAVTGRPAILGKLSMTGGQSLDHFREMINRATGANVTIKEFEPVAAGAVAGVPLYGADWRFVWEVAGLKTSEVTAAKAIVEESRQAHVFVTYKAEDGQYV